MSPAAKIRRPGLSGGREAKVSAVSLVHGLESLLGFGPSEHRGHLLARHQIQQIAPHARAHAHTHARMHAHAHTRHILLFHQVAVGDSSQASRLSRNSAMDDAVGDS